MHNQSISSAARKRRADHGHAETALVADNRFGEIRRSSRRRGKMRMALTALAALVGFKGAVLADLGAVNYIARLEYLRDGDAIDRIGSFVMGIDPLTLQVAQWIAPMIG
ncbi:hypothetical protein CBW24_12695 [Pacificitalea manganoxidans]|uniref:Uncharacterized protein n=1 Tax=Pacificitalea manganoxidans TaxID=1411902 RepID=A0A291M1K1_9RHOB|nr:hypothetical protein [Pacificitalea manganoxidans]ATI42774.1 hypothetical protein CBW24_12695 [Pacificitalea manganoxidans]MDR6307325.1 hypothetical protein [Pacificitalea manganoxidans]